MPLSITCNKGIKLWRVKYIIERRTSERERERKKLQIYDARSGR